ncbi:MAG: type II toxin-antitoxin system VapC family toxin [Pseudomonadota bacterium]
MVGRLVRITVDTNVLIRAIVADDEGEAIEARSALRQATLIALPTPMLCELVWVLRRGYKLSPAEVATTVRTLVDAAETVANRDAVEAGLALLEAGGDFADGAIAAEGRALGGDIFTTFDRKAARLLEDAGEAPTLLSATNALR